MSIQLYDPNSNSYVQLDSGRVSQEMLLVNILIELQVHTMYLQQMHTGVVDDDPIQLRKDIVNNPSTILGN
jgi:hypothetical protein